MSTDEDLIFQEFESLGYARVSANLAAGRYGRPKNGLAMEWLKRMDQDREDGAARESNAIARSAKNAAWTAAIAAIVAAIVATIAAVISYLTWAAQHPS